MTWSPLAVYVLIPALGIYPAILGYRGLRKLFSNDPDFHFISCGTSLLVAALCFVLPFTYSSLAKYLHSVHDVSYRSIDTVIFVYVCVLYFFLLLFLEAISHYRRFRSTRLFADLWLPIAFSLVSTLALTYGIARLFGVSLDSLFPSGSENTVPDNAAISSCYIYGRMSIVTTGTLPLRRKIVRTLLLAKNRAHLTRPAFFTAFKDIWQ